MIKNKFINKKRLINQSGFSILEILIVVLVISILSVVAVPIYNSYTAHAKKTTVKSIVAMTRTAVSTFYTKKIAAVGSGSYPSYSEFVTTGVVLEEPLLANPFNKLNSTQDADTLWNATNPPTDNSTGWNYDATNGKFWANTSVDGENLL